MLAYECTWSLLLLGLDKFCSRWRNAHTLHIRVFQQMKKLPVLKLVNYPATTINTTNSNSRAAGPLDPCLEKCKCISRKMSSYFRGTSMNYACNKVEVLTLPLKYPIICKNLFPMTSVTSSDLIQGSLMQPKDHQMKLIGYSSSHRSTLSLFVKLKFSINLQMLKTMLCKICLCCRLTNVQVYEWEVIILDTVDYLGTCNRIKSLYWYDYRGIGIIQEEALKT